MSTKPGAFSSAAATEKRELVVKRDSLTPHQAEAVESGQDESLYSMTALNHLQLSGFSGLTSLSPRVDQLGDLLQLILAHNSLASVPSELGQLTKLKLLDIAHNQLTELPQSLYSLPSLQTLLLAHNCLTDASFPDLPQEGPLPSLHHVDLTHNQLTELPPFIYSSHGLLELRASDNSISVLEARVGSLVGLRQLELQRNKLTVLPYELVNCSKLKSLALEDNPLDDRRLMKLIAQHGAHKPKAVLDYIASHAPSKSVKPGEKKRAKKKKKAGLGAQPTQEAGSDLEVEFAENRPVIRVVRPAHYVEVCASAEARRVRPYLVFAVVRGLDLSREEAFRQFIALQTKLHDTVCKRRRVATIATHDLSRVVPPLAYSCAPAEAISFAPLGRETPLTAQQFLDHIQTNRPQRGAGKQAKPPDPAAAALSKYLGFVNPLEMVYLRDSADLVISLPPLTNCEHSKIKPTSRDLLLEVTSNDNLGACKSVMDALLVGMCEEGLVGSDGVLCVEQGKVIDTGGQLLVLYPSKTDLSSENVEVRRP